MKAVLCLSKICILVVAVVGSAYAGDDYSYEKLNELAPPKPVKEHFLKKWLSPPLKQRGDFKVKSFKRMTAVAGRVYPIATLNYFQMPAKDFKDWQVLSLIERGFEVKWKKKLGKTHASIEGYWPGANRYMRYSFKKEGNHLHLVLSSLRVGYWDATYPETLFMEKAFFNQTKKTSYYQRHFFLNFVTSFIPEAKAQGNPFSFLGGGTNPTPGGGTSNNPLVGVGPDFSGIEDGIENLNSSMMDFNTNFEVLTTQFDSLNTNIEGANVNWGDTNDQIAAIQGSLQDGIDRFDENWDETNRIAQEGVDELANTTAVMDENWDRTNAEFARANDLAAKALDPKHMFTLAAATSAGAVLGATLAQTAIDLMVMGAGAVLEAITGAKAKEERWERFKEARQAWEKNLETAKNLEKVLDNFLLSQAMMREIKKSLPEDQQDKLTREDLISHLSINTRILKKRLKQKEDKFMNTDSIACEQLYAEQMTEIEKLINQQEGLKKVLEACNFSIYDDDYFCDQLPRLLGKLAEAEAQLAQYRLDILSARAEWAEHERERVEDMADQMERLNEGKPQEDFIKEQKRTAKTTLDLYMDGLAGRRAAWVDQCEDFVDEVKKEKDPVVLAAICDNRYEDWSLRDQCKSHFAVGRWAPTDRKVEVCEKAYDNSVLGKRHEEMALRAQASYERKVQRIESSRSNFRRDYLMNLEVEDQRLLSYFNFFEDIQEQQFCFENPNEVKCKDKSQVKFMGPFYVKDRAKVKLREICGLNSFLE